MAQQDMVTLEHPDGRRRYRTDNASEINMLVGSYGYRRVEQENAKSARSNKHTAPKPSTPPSPPETPPSAEASSS